MRSLLRRLPPDRFVVAGAEVAVALGALRPWREACSVFLFAATRTEPDMSSVLAAALERGMLVAFPRVAATALHYIPYDAAAGLSPGFRGVREPPVATPALEFAQPRGPVVVLVPGAAFAGNGCRLGWGGGHYDRSLAAWRAHRDDLTCIGVGVREQLVGRVPTASHDQRLDLVLTDAAAASRPARSEQP